MRCSKCGAELSEDTKFCSYCGNKVEMPPKQENVSEEDIPPISLDEQVQDFQNQKGHTGVGPQNHCRQETGSRHQCPA